MSQDSNLPTGDTVGHDVLPKDGLNAALAAAFAPESTHPVSPQQGVLRAIGSTLSGPITTVHLREPDEEALTPVVRPRPSGRTPAPDLQGPGGRYQIAGEIARGGMGAILRGRDTDLGRDLALKVLLESHKGRPEFVQRFVEEAQITGQLQHPGITPVYELGQLADQRPYFTMKLVKGRTLLALLSARKDAGEDRSRFVAVFAQIAQTLAYAHARGVIHRDLKPSNVMVGAFGEVQVMDWGLAKVLGEGGVADEKKAREKRADVSEIRTARSDGSARFGSKGSETQAGSILGTPAYMPPEQAQGDIDRLDERADVFGLGAILCEVLTGKPPYEGDDSSVVRSMALRGSLESAFARLDACGADRELVSLAKRCLAADRKDRPADAGVVAAEVTAYLSAVEARLRQAELEAVAARTRAEEERKRRRITLVLATSVLLAAGIGGGAWLHFQSEHDARVAKATRDANEALADARKLRDQARSAGVGDVALWDRARKRLDLASALAANGLVDPAVASKVEEDRASLDEEEKDARLLAALARASTADAETNPEEDRSARDRVLPLYREAFRAYGLPPGEIGSLEAAKRIRERPPVVRDAVIATLDDWIRHSGARGPDIEWVKSVVKDADPDSWRTRAREAAQRKDREALEGVVAEVDVKHQPPLELAAIAMLLFDLGGRESAVSLLRNARREHPADFSVNHNLGVLLWRLGSKHCPEAARYATAAVALEPRSARARRSLGVILFYANDHEAGVLEVRRAIDLEPGYAVAWSNLGYCLSQQGKHEEALAAERRAIELNAGDAGEWHNLGLTLRTLGKTAEGNDALRRSVELAPGDTRNLVTLAQQLVSDGQPDEAFAALKAGLEARPDAADLHAACGYVWWQAEKNLSEARAAYERALELQPDLASAHHDLAHVLEEEGDLEAAIAEHRKATRDGPESASFHSCLGAALGRTSKTGEARVELRKSVELDPLSSDVHNNLAWALLGMGDVDEAIASGRKAVELDPRNSKAHDTVAQALARRGDLDEAVTSFREALRLDPALAESQSGLVGALSRLGMLPEGIVEASQNDAKLPPAAVLLARLEGLPAVRALEEVADLELGAAFLDHRLDELRRKALPDLPTFASIDAALAAEALVLEGDAWRYFAGTEEPSPGLEWTLPEFDNVAWMEGSSGFGYGDGDDRTVLDGKEGRFTTIYVRRRVAIPSPGSFSRVTLRVRSDDGFIAYWNGEEVGRFRAGRPGERLAHDASASADHEALATDVLVIPARLLKPGENTIAIQGLNKTFGSSDFTLIPEVWGEEPVDSDGMRGRFATFRAGAGGADAAARISYLEGRWLEMEGRYGEALVELEKAAAVSPREPLPLQRIAECLESLGKTAEAAARIRSAVPSLDRWNRKLLERWVAAEKAAGKDWNETLARWPRRAPPFEGAPRGSPARKPGE